MVLSQLIHLLGSLYFWVQIMIHLQPQCGKCLHLLVGNDNADEGEICIALLVSLLYFGFSIFGFDSTQNSMCVHLL